MTWKGVMDATLEVRDLDRSCQAFSKGCRTPAKIPVENRLNFLSLKLTQEGNMRQFQLSSTRGINPVRRYSFMGVILKQVASSEAASREGSTVQ